MPGAISASMKLFKLNDKLFATFLVVNSKHPVVAKHKIRKATEGDRNSVGRKVVHRATPTIAFINARLPVREIPPLAKLKRNSRSGDSRHDGSTRSAQV